MRRPGLQVLPGQELDLGLQDVDSWETSCAPLRTVPVDLQRASPVSDQDRIDSVEPTQPSRVADRGAMVLKRLDEVTSSE